ncbi:hypothetical protein HK102_002357 [Quaeritorhiza haematococci]|nr:hypothetical protein HK102_002357 [Quaeritorhiza haematococci]
MKIVFGSSSQHLKRTTVNDESAVVALAEFYVHEVVQFPMAALGDAGAIGKFVSHTGQKDVVGDPDRVWRVEETQKAKVVVEYKTWWAVPVDGDLIPVWENFQRLLVEKAARMDMPTRKAGKAIQQVYGYATFKYVSAVMAGSFNHGLLPDTIITGSLDGEEVVFMTADLLRHKNQLQKLEKEMSCNISKAKSFLVCMRSAQYG